MRARKPALVLILGHALATSAGCDSARSEALAEPTAATVAADPGAAEAPAIPTEPVLSLTGAVLEPTPIPEAFASEQEAKLADARGREAADPRDLEAAIWVGRHLGYLARYRAAIEHYTVALQRFPDEPRLLRHRGHRFITVRDLTAAIADFERAAALVADAPDRIEEDGLPNARNQPTSTLRTNIEYHLGLAYFLQGRFEEAEVAYRRCLELSKNPDMEVATRQWLFATLVRLDRWEQARAVIAPVTAEWDIIENDAYRDLILMAKGERTAESLLQQDADDAPSSAAARFGVAHFRAYVGTASALQADDRSAREAMTPDAASALFDELARDPGWAAFGVIAADAEVARGRARDAVR